MLAGGAAIVREGPERSESNHALALQILESVASRVEEGAAAGQFNILAAEAAYEAAILIDPADLATRLSAVLSTVTWDQYLAGAIMSFEPERKGNPIKLPTTREVESRHPVLGSEYALRVIRECGGCLEHCISRNYELAFSGASSPWEVQSIVTTQAMLGDVDEAIASLHKLTDDERRREALLVLVIELYRRGRDAEAHGFQSQIEPLGEWELIHLALGLSHRAPWTIYPYADY